MHDWHEFLNFVDIFIFLLFIFHRNFRLVWIVYKKCWVIYTGDYEHWAQHHVVLNWAFTFILFFIIIFSRPFHWYSWLAIQYIKHAKMIQYVPVLYGQLLHLVTSIRAIEMHVWLHCNNFTDTQMRILHWILHFVYASTYTIFIYFSFIIQVANLIN